GLHVRKDAESLWLGLARVACHEHLRLLRGPRAENRAPLHQERPQQHKQPPHTYVSHVPGPAHQRHQAPLLPPFPPSATQPRTDRGGLGQDPSPGSNPGAAARGRLRGPAAEPRHIVASEKREESPVAAALSIALSPVLGCEGRRAGGCAARRDRVRVGLGWVRGRSAHLVQRRSSV
ncbi:hypothetical protein T484DRAFT_1875868, partial [Baffinella frigidus]